MVIAAQTWDAWVVHPRPNPKARLRLFCFPYAGGGASVFRFWWRYLPETVELCAIQLPGRENRLREKPYTRMGELVETLAQVLEPELRRPFAFFGHSMGALLSFDLACMLQRQSHYHPLHLFAAACRAPQLGRVKPPIHHLSDTAFIAQLRSLGGTPEAAFQNHELMTLLLPVLRADMAMCETRRPALEHVLTCPITALGGTEDKGIDEAALSAWDQQTRGAFTLRLLPGGHFFLHTNYEQLLKWIIHDLSRVAELT